MNSQGKFVRFGALTAVMLMLTACGGGGSSSQDAPAGGGDDSGTAQFQCTVESAGAYTISGNVTVAPGSIVDSDTLAAGSRSIDNGSFAAAQPIPRPVSVGGYASKGNSSLTGTKDTNDFYSVDLKAGDVITMLVGDAVPGLNDLDMYLYDVNRRLVGASIRSGTLEALEVPADGLYFVEVRVYLGSSTYVLSVGGGVGPQVVPGNFLDQEFLPGELVVRYRPQQDGASIAATASLADDSGLEYIAGSPGRVMRMRLPDFAQASAAVASAAGPLFTDPVEEEKYRTLMAIKDLQQDPRVEFASPNYIRRPQAVPNDPLYSEQWHYRLIDLPAAWDMTTGDAGVVVAVIDTGVRTDHPDLAGKLVDGYDFVSSVARAGDGDGIDSDPYDPFGGVYHGTHVAGTVAAATNNGEGVAGVGWGVRVMPLRALGEDEGTFYDIIQAMLYAAGLPNDSGRLPSRRADLINLSLGGPLVVPDGFEQSIVDQIRAEGVIIVAAAGNQANSVPFYPASYAGVISVSAVRRPLIADGDPALASYSSFGPDIDIAAPGGDGLDAIVSTSGPACDNRDRCPLDAYAGLRGTSMAAPHVAGVVALMQSARRSIGEAPLSPLEFDSLLQDQLLTRDLGARGRDDQFGYGLIDAGLAVGAAMKVTIEPPPTELVITPASINFRNDLTAASVIVSNAGGGELRIESVAELPPAAGWLSVDRPGTSDGLGVYVFRVNRAGLAAGEYTATVRVQSNAGQQDIAVTLTADSNARLGDVGNILVRLYDAETVSPTGAERLIDSRDGNYEFADVPGGCYIVAAGTNLDRDSFIGDVGEAWSGYPSKTVLDPVLLDSDARGIDFEVSFDRVELVPSQPAVSGAPVTIAP